MFALSNASTPDRAGVAASTVRQACVAAELGAATTWVVNDLVPLVALGEPGRSHLVAVCGTATGFGVCTDDSRSWRASGQEYLLSDEGGGHDVGVEGLQASVRAVDGRGPATALVEEGVGRVLSIGPATVRLAGSMLVETSGELCSRVVRRLAADHPAWEPVVERRTPLEVLAAVLDLFGPGEDPIVVIGLGLSTVRLMGTGITPDTEASGTPWPVTDYLGTA